MYYKLISTTEFDANFELYESTQTECVIMAPDKKFAEKWFRYLHSIGACDYKSYSEIEEATKEEYESFCNANL